MGRGPTSVSSPKSFTEIINMAVRVCRVMNSSLSRVPATKSVVAAHPPSGLLLFLRCSYVCVCVSSKHSTFDSRPYLKNPVHLREGLPRFTSDVGQEST
jgi:hypothetical protein